MMKVELLTYTPEPEKVIEIAGRTCYQSAIGNPSIIQNWIRSGHESVIEHASATFRVSEVSRALSHQLVRHRIASYSQQSQRYVKFKSENKKTPWSKFTEQEEYEISELYNKGNSTIEISDQYLCNPQTISNILKSNGIALREKGEQSCMNSNLFNPETLTEIEAQLLGLIAADGNVFIMDNDNGKITIKLKDKKFVEQIAVLFNSNVFITRENLFVTSLHSKNVCKTLVEKWGIIPNKTFLMKYDLIEKNLKENLINHYIRGFLEGDGSILYYPDKKKYMIVFASVIDDSLIWINREIYKNCGISEKNICNKKTVKHLQYQGINEIKKIIKWLYKDFSLDFVLDRKLTSAYKIYPDIQSEILKSCLNFSEKYHVVIPDSIKNNIDCLLTYTEAIYKLINFYNDLEYKIPKEDRRMLLPNACHTEIVVTMNFRALRNLLKLRLDAHAQWEIQNMAYEMLKLIKPIAPNCFFDYITEVKENE